jgi:hypothetical protein
MDLSLNAQLLLDRCKTMNCLYAGQSISLRSFANICGGDEPTTKATDELIGHSFFIKSATGTYTLTEAGAGAIKSTTASIKDRSHAKRAERPPINKI